MHPSFALLFWFYKRRGAFNEKANTLLDQYSAGDVLNLTFDVLNVGNYQGITFESLDYFEAAYAHNNGAAYPNIQDYQ